MRPVWVSPRVAQTPVEARHVATSLPPPPKRRKPNKLITLDPGPPRPDLTPDTIHLDDRSHRRFILENPGRFAAFDGFDIERPPSAQETEWVFRNIVGVSAAEWRRWHREPLVFTRIARKDMCFLCHRGLDHVYLVRTTSKLARRDIALGVVCAAALAEYVNTYPSGRDGSSLPAPGASGHAVPGLGFSASPLPR